ncbi:MAG: hypothetical protein EXQ52_11450 [Bryobacterales bacterium]|nr:hypothetical protein [Bryobacterales bacterium]
MIEAGQLLTLDSLKTYGGLSMAVIAVTNSLSMAFGWKPKWLGLVVSLAICISLQALMSNQASGLVFFLASLNAFLIYFTAIGGNAVAGAAVSTGAAVRQAEVGGTQSAVGKLRTTDYRSRGMRFFQPWL